MKIAIVHMRLGLKGGLETRLLNYVEEFRRMGHDVTVVTSKVTGEVSLPNDVHIIKIDLSSVPKPVRQWFFANRLEEALVQYQHDMVLSMSRSRSQDCLIAPTTHKGYLKSLKNKFLTPLHIMINRLEQKAFESSRYIFACSSMIRQEVIDLYGIAENKVSVLFPPLNANRFKQGSIYSNDELRNKFGLPVNANICVFVSTSHKRKGLPLLLQVFEQLQHDNIHLVVAGTPFKTKLPNVHALGFVRDTPELFHAANLTLHPASYEPFGQVVSESIACGTPVLVGPHVGAREIIDSRVGEVMVDYEQATWVNGIKKALNSRFDIPADFALAKGITLAQHCQVILDTFHSQKE